ncbi:putative neutral ceramidase superfamily lipid hydrolase [Chryseobacterium rhizosphaerae]|nr:putative neutral ceramidase superfamily lipid hydrolase [Chryseobacterium rhizosphaerae]
MKNRKILFNTMLFSLIYVILGTIAVVVSFPKYSILGFDYNSPLWMPLVIVTFPVNITLFGLVMVDNSILSIFILQSIVFLILWFVLYKLVLYYFKVKNKKEK